MPFILGLVIGLSFSCFVTFCSQRRDIYMSFQWSKTWKFVCYQFQAIFQTDRSRMYCAGNCEFVNLLQVLDVVYTVFRKWCPLLFSCI